MRFLIFILFFVEHTSSFSDSLWSWNNEKDSFYGNLPITPNYTSTLEISSSCANGNISPDKNYGFACPHMMMFSSDMLLASQYDNLHNDFLYAVAGAATEQECGNCYQIQLLDAERIWRPDFKQLIVQVINSGNDVLKGQMDIFMGAGGFGWYTSCNVDCATNYCGGGACHESMYDSPFTTWTQAQYNDPNLCYSGGIKWLNQKSASELQSLCNNISPFKNSIKDQITVDSCFHTNWELYHQNFVSTRYIKVACPEGLVMLTGLKTMDNQEHPYPSLSIPLTQSCNGNRTIGQYCITNMQDCCKQTCAWSNKGEPDPDFLRVYTCKKDGSIWYY